MPAARDEDEDRWDGSWEGYDGHDEPDYDPDPEFDDPADEDDVTAPCPYCRRPIHDDSVQCPACGNYLSREDEPPERKPGWVVFGLVISRAIAFWWILG